MLLPACDSESDEEILMPHLVDRTYEKTLHMDKLILPLQMIVHNWE